jgi:hypothetical protein
MNFVRNIQFPLHLTQILTLIIFILQATSKKFISEKIEFNTIYKYHNYTSQILKQYYNSNT